MHLKAAVRFETQHATIEHGDDEHAAVRQPTEAGGLGFNAADDGEVAGVVDAQDFVAVEVGEVQATIAPARGFGEAEVGEEDAGL